MTGVHWGKRRENGVWLAPKRHRRFMFRNHASLYVAFGHFRLRLMKPWRDSVMASGDEEAG